jgi:flagellar hook-associated protein 2
VSDISIPGISNNRGMNTSQMVDDLMELERQPVRRMETRVETYGEQQDAWRSMGRTLGQLRDASRRMYGFENPFRDRIASSSDQSVLTASATRQARESIEELTVLQTAGRDRFASRPVDRDFRVTPGRYQFSVGDEERTFRFGGGTLEDFSDAVNERLGSIVRTAVVPDTRETRVFVVEGLQEGSEAILGFGEDAAPLMEEIGVLAPARQDRQVSLLSESPLRLEPGTTDEIRLDSPFPIEPGMVLRFEARTEEIPREPWSPPPVPPDRTSPSVDRSPSKALRSRTKRYPWRFRNRKRPSRRGSSRTTAPSRSTGPGVHEVSSLPSRRRHVSDS